MAIKTYKPTSPGRRFLTNVSYKNLSKVEPEKSLLRPLKKKAGRNFQGRITVRHQGGGAKRQYRLIDFRRDKDDIPARVATIEYDPNRTAFIALLNYEDGEKRYILAPERLEVGDVVESGMDADIKPGNALPIRYIPVGTVIHNVEITPGKGGQMARSAGSSAQLTAKEDRYAHVRLPSGEVRMVLLDCRATIGTVSNSEHELVTIGKAGRSRHMGIRPGVRGSAMNPVDHPHGGGEGRAPIGRPSPMTPWGKIGRGVKTRNPKKKTNQYIVRSRRRKK